MFLKLSKFFYLILLIYMTWFQVVFPPINNMLLFLGVIMLIPLVIDMLDNKTNLIYVFPFELVMWVIFGIVLLFSGMFTAKNLNLHFSSTMTYFQFILVMFTIIYISIREKKCDFFINSFIIIALLSALSSVVSPYDYGGGRISMSATNNPNALGLTMVFAFGFLLFKLDFKKISKTIIVILILLLFTYVIVLTGSRKSILGLLIIFVFWLVVRFDIEIKKMKIKSILKYVTIIIIGIYSTYLLIYPIFSDSVLLVRLTYLFETGDSERVNMYKEAWDIFLKFPIFGAGMQQYRVLSTYQTYSHSTYAEILANSGLIGIILYFTPYISLGFKFFTKSFSSSSDKVVTYRLFLIMYFLVLFLGLSIIHFYDTISFIFFGIIISQYYIYNGKGEKSSYVESKYVF